VPLTVCCCATRCLFTSRCSWMSGIMSGAFAALDSALFSGGGGAADPASPGRGALVAGRFGVPSVVRSSLAHMLTLPVLVTPTQIGCMIVRSSTAYFPSKFYSSSGDPGIAAGLTKSVHIDKLCAILESQRRPPAPAGAGRSRTPGHETCSRFAA
jgi:hypothetical protein